MNDQELYGAPQQPQAQDPMQALLAQLGILGGAQDQQAALQQKMMMAQALRQPNGRQQTTGVGAAMSGAGDLIGNLVGGLQQKQLMGQQDTLNQQTGQARGGYLQALAQALRGGGGPGGPPGP